MRMDVVETRVEFNLHHIPRNTRVGKQIVREGRLNQRNRMNRVGVVAIVGFATKREGRAGASGSIGLFVSPLEYDFFFILFDQP